MNELNFQGDPDSVTLIARIYDDAWVQVGGDIAMTETGASNGLYSGDVPLATVPDGRYRVHFVDGGVVLGAGELLWRDDAEVDAEHMNTLREADAAFDFSVSTMTLERRGTGTPLIPAKAVVGQASQQDVTIIEP